MTDRRMKSFIGSFFLLLCTMLGKLVQTNFEYIFYPRNISIVSVSVSPPKIHIGWRVCVCALLLHQLWCTVCTVLSSLVRTLDKSTVGKATINYMQVHIPGGLV